MGEAWERGYLERMLLVQSLKYVQSRVHNSWYIQCIPYGGYFSWGVLFLHFFAVEWDPANIYDSYPCACNSTVLSMKHITATIAVTKLLLSMRLVTHEPAHSC